MLKQRQLDVLRLVVQLFTTTGQPVGSATLRDLGVEASSATIRNDLALLEELGFLEKTHVSSGRIPSMQGYRYYVEHLLSPKPMTKEDEMALHQSFGEGFFEMDDLLQKSVKILSKFTDMTTFILGPSHNERILTEFHLVKVSKSKGMAIVVTNLGNVESQIFPIPEQLTDEDFEQMEIIANAKFVGETLEIINQRLNVELPIVLQKYVQNPQVVIALFESILKHLFEEKVYVGGQVNLLDFVPATDVQSFKKVFRLVNNREELLAMLPKSNNPIDIVIGDELGNELLQDMTLITAKYNVVGAETGMIALLGPSKMEYDETLGIVESFRNEIEQQVHSYYQGLESLNNN